MSSSTKTFALGKSIHPNPPKLPLSSLSRKRMEASDLIDKLKDAKVFTKFNVHWGYNNVRIKEGDQWKAAFITHRGLYEPTIMFFGMTNSPPTFQRFMSDSFRDMIAEGWLVIYMDDLLIYSDNDKDHEE